MSQTIRALVVAAAFALCQAALANAQDVQGIFEPTADEFRNSCASCHGEDGKGFGFLTRLFQGMDAGNLTQISKNNGGVFPLEAVFQTIDGSNEVAAHGPREMPVWGERYMGRCRDECDPDERRREVRRKILELVYYIQSIQER